MSKKIEIYSGEITDWNWTRDYGIAKILSGPMEGNDVFVHYANVKYKAKDEEGNLVVLNGKQVYGREAAQGFEFNGDPVEIRKNMIWFDLYEKIYFTLDDKAKNIAFNVTFTEQDTEDSYTEEFMRKGLSKRI